MRRAWALAAVFFTVYLIAGCASPVRVKASHEAKVLAWQGRLALRLQVHPTESQVPDPSFSAPFELQGNAQQGDLVLLTPLGSTAAAIHWVPGKAVLQTQGEIREFTTLNQLISELLGTDVPVTALFAWLNGEAQEVDGWQVDLSQRLQGKILARRQSPAPPAELRLVLDN